jgi:hypothetical protein
MKQGKNKRRAVVYRAMTIRFPLNAGIFLEDKELFVPGIIINISARGGVVIKALRFKPAGRGFDSRLCHWNISVT